MHEKAAQVWCVPIFWIIIVSGRCDQRKRFDRHFFRDHWSNKSLAYYKTYWKNGVNEEVVLASQTKQRSCGELPIAVVAGAGKRVNLNTWPWELKRQEFGLPRPCVYLYISVCVYVCVCDYLHIYTHIYNYIYKLYVYIYIYIFANIYIYIYIFANIYIYIYMYIHIIVSICIYICVYIYVYIYVCI